MKVCKNQISSKKREMFSKEFVILQDTVSTTSGFVFLFFLPTLIKEFFIFVNEYRMIEQLEYEQKPIPYWEDLVKNCSCFKINIFLNSQQ